ncbi:hypothetical protein ACLB2K_005029 [Fragaria x ananassa]
MIERNKSKTFRGLYYLHKNIYKSQSRSIAAIKHLCCKLVADRDRESMNIHSDDVSVVIGLLKYTTHGIATEDCNWEASTCCWWRGNETSYASSSRHGSVLIITKTKSQPLVSLHLPPSMTLMFSKPRVATTAILTPLSATAIIAVHVVDINGHPSPHPCPHLASFKSKNGSKPFRALQDCLRINPPGGRASIRRDPDELPRCAACADPSHSRIYACVACAAVHCHAPSGRSHAAVQAASMPLGHEIAVDVDRAELFCCACRDQVYDCDFDAAVVLAQTATASSSGVIHAPENIRKRRRIDYKPLYSWWQYAANLASYEQQDAHEFFISTLDGIHEKELTLCSQFRAYFHPLPAGFMVLSASLQFRVKLQSGLKT